MTRGIFHQGYFNADPYNYLEVRPSKYMSSNVSADARVLGHCQFRNL